MNSDTQFSENHMSYGAASQAAALKARFNPEGSPLRRMQLRMLEMVELLDDVCRRHGIPYFLYGGTLLGAMRHNGFIPWDDDLDVGLLRRDYLRLLEVLPAELPEHIALQTNDTDPTTVSLRSVVSSSTFFLSTSSACGRTCWLSRCRRIRSRFSVWQPIRNV